MDSGWDLAAVIGFSHLAYSSRTIFRTRLIMLPTVVSEGWAAVILLPSLRIISIRSPETEQWKYICNNLLKDDDKLNQTALLFSFSTCSSVA